MKRTNPNVKKKHSQILPIRAPPQDGFLPTNSDRLYLAFFLNFMQHYITGDPILHQPFILYESKLKMQKYSLPQRKLKQQKEIDFCYSEPRS